MCKWGGKKNGLRFGWKRVKSNSVAFIFRKLFYRCTRAYTIFLFFSFLFSQTTKEENRKGEKERKERKKKKDKRALVTSI